MPNSLEVYWHTGRTVLPNHYSSKFNEGTILRKCFPSLSLTAYLPVLERVVFLFLSFGPPLSFSVTPYFCILPLFVLLGISLELKSQAQGKCTWEAQKSMSYFIIKNPHWLCLVMADVPRRSTQRPFSNLFSSSALMFDVFLSKLSMNEV
ncbi:hypothetical protein ATANTOWER_027483 [Ataeniobius toweri]|uniref:Uncharacterized protein n=1 Tax=Ataeniobius toweri TaxID=208326 RepID=A0ABU7AKG6_9TELE|nr:hypothetical protein [Ataeniobius toweri]